MSKGETTLDVEQSVTKRLEVRNHLLKNLITSQVIECTSFLYVRYG